MFRFGTDPVIPNFATGCDLQNSSRKSNLSCVSIGSATKLKNIRTLIVGWNLVLKYRPEAWLNLIGPELGTDEEIYIWAKNLNLNHNINWIGNVNHADALTIVSESVLMVHPSLEESFGLSILESMSLGVPVIGGKVSGAVPYLISDTGVLVDVTSADEIASAINWMLGDDSARNKLGARAKTRATTEFSPELAVNAYLKIFERISKN
jgi:glycosyltransferase involved in cell wall biosynthesis